MSMCFIEEWLQTSSVFDFYDLHYYLQKEILANTKNILEKHLQGRNTGKEGIYLACSAFSLSNSNAACLYVVPTPHPAPKAVKATLLFLPPI